MRIGAALFACVFGWVSGASVPHHVEQRDNATSTPSAAANATSSSLSTTLLNSTTSRVQNSTTSTSAPLQSQVQPVYKAGTPIVILKLDDLHRFGQCINRFDAVQHLLVNNKIKAGFGVITRSIEPIGYNDHYCRWLRSLERTGYIEIWNHGVDHVRGEFLGSEEDQFNKLAYSQNLLKKCGIDSTAFGAPFNGNNNETMKALRRMPALTNLFFPAEGTIVDDSSSVFVYGNYPFPAQRCDMEFSRVGHVNFDYFMKNYESIRYKQPVIVLQGHPAAWDSTYLLEFRRILKYLRSQNTIFMKPSEYLDFAVEQVKALKGAPRVVSTTFTHRATLVDDTKERDATHVVTMTTTVSATIAPSVPARFLRDEEFLMPTTSTHEPKATPTSIWLSVPTQAASTFQLLPVPPELQ